MQTSDHRHDQVRLLQQVGSIVTAFGDSLRAATIDVDSIAIFGHKLRCCNQVVRVICSELDGQGPISFARREHFLPVFGVCGKEPGVKHRCVAKSSTVFTCEHPKRKL